MGISNRIFRLAKANLNALLEAVGEERDSSELQGLSDEALESELARRKLRREREELERDVRDRAERAARERFGAGAPPGRGRRPRGYDAKLARYYAQLELPYGSDLETVKSAYRSLMRKYHPDRHAANPEKQRAATNVAQALGEAYRELEKALGGQ